MNVDRMRRIDRYAGVPLCFLLGLLHKLLSWFRKPVAKEPGKVLFIELSEMGSAILADPAMRWLESRGKELHFVIFEKNAPSLQLLKTVPEANIFTIRPDNLLTLALDSLRFLWWCRSREIDTVIDLELFSRFTALLSHLCGAVNRVGFDRVHEEGLYRGNFLTHPVMYNPHKHISYNFMVLVQAALAEAGQPYQKKHIADDQIQLAKAYVPSSATQAVAKKVESIYPAFEQEHVRLMLINPNASDLLPQRRWARAGFAEVIRSVLAEYDDILVLITGAPSEKQGAELLAQEVGHERCLNTAGLFQFDELVPLYSISGLMLSNDSGPPHFASVTDLPTYVIFGPETPRLYGALGNSTPIYAGLSCSPCVSAGNHRKTTCTDNRCLQAITPADVLAVIRPRLEAQLIAKVG